MGNAHSSTREKGYQATILILAAALFFAILHIHHVEGLLWQYYKLIYTYQDVPEELKTNNLIDLDHKFKQELINRRMHQKNYPNGVPSSLDESKS